MTDLKDEIASELLDICSAYSEGRVDKMSGCAQAIIDLIIARIPPLVWHKSTIKGWNGDYHTVLTGYTVRCADEWGWKWSNTLGASGHRSSPEAAQASANAHHVAQLCKGMGIE